MSSAKTTYRNNLRWSGFVEDGGLVISKGADEMYVVDELDGEEAALLLHAYTNGTLESPSVQAHERIRNVIQKLEKAGVIYRGVHPDRRAEPARFAVRWCGYPNQGISRFLKTFAEGTDRVTLADDPGVADLLVIIRSSSPLTDLIEQYEEIDLPHLFVDIAYDHTISLGPLVFPGQTACLRCFVMRITRNWGDAQPPRDSGASDSTELIAALVFEQVKTFQKIGSCPELVEKSWSFNLRAMTAQTDAIFRLPWCPTCFPQGAGPEAGALSLPWVGRSRSAE